MADAREWARGAVERLLEDEGLRGNLGDAGYTPLLEWAVALVEQRAAHAKGQAEVDALGGKVREAVRALVKAAEAGHAPAAAALKGVGVALPGVALGADADANAAALAAALTKAG